MRYIYKCPECKRETEEYHRITDDPMLICEECAKKDKTVYLERVLSNVGVIFKGTGFYETDYKDKK